MPIDDPTRPCRCIMIFVPFYSGHILCVNSLVCVDQLLRITAFMHSNPTTPRSTLHRSSSAPGLFLVSGGENKPEPFWLSTPGLSVVVVVVHWHTGCCVIVFSAKTRTITWGLAKHAFENNQGSGIKMEKHSITSHALSLLPSFFLIFCFFAKTSCLHRKCVSWTWCLIKVNFGLAAVSPSF